METSSTIQYKIETTKKNPGESDLDSIRRLVLEQAKQGWRIVEASGDENLKPSLIFEKASGPLGEIRVEEIAKVKGSTDVVQVYNKVDEYNAEGWLPLTVLDSIFTQPIVVLEKAASSPADPQLLLKAVCSGVFESIPKAILEEVEAEALNKRTLKTIMNSGLEPVLMFGANVSGKTYKYEVEYAKGGLFSNRAKELTKLVEQRANDGWHLCGAFEDSFRMPCVVFNREST
jgi:hypothetical protein